MIPAKSDPEPPLHGCNTKLIHTTITCVILPKHMRIETEINVYSYINAVNNRLSCKQGIAETRSATLPTSRRWITASVPLDRNKIRAVIFTQN